MRALVWPGKEDIRCDTVTAPEIEEPRDAIVKVTSCAICGSDLHLFLSSRRCSLTTSWDTK
jgi:threonine dehydrogenase-like Zn-dependent dehydrogenase